MFVLVCSKGFIDYDVDMPKERKPKRTMAEYQASRINHVEVTPALREILDGVLLSDACFSSRGSRNTSYLRITQNKTRVGWLQLVSLQLNEHGVQTRLGEVFHRPSFIDGRRLPGGTYDLLRTLNYAEFVQEEDRWYSVDRKKRVPRDLLLTPTVLNHWFCGDGRGGDKKGTLGFATDGFAFDDVEFLIDKLGRGLGVEALLQTNHRGHPQILVSKRDEAMKVRQLLEPIIPECCRYKLQHTRPRQTVGRGRKLSAGLKQAIREDRFSSTYKAASLKHSVSVSTVWKLWNEEK